MKQYKVIVSQKSMDCIAGMVLYIAEENMQAARNVKNAILGAIRSLQSMPERAPFLEGEFIPYNKYRKMVVLRRYLIIYQIKDNVVYVDYVVDCKQDYEWLVK